MTTSLSFPGFAPETKKTKEDRVGRALPMPTTNGSCMGPAQVFQAFTTGLCIDLCRATVVKRESLGDFIHVGQEHQTSELQESYLIRA